MDDREKAIPEDEEIEIITLTGDDGKDVQFEHLLTLSYDEGLYAVVHPQDDPEEGSVYFLEITKDADGEDVLKVVENDILSQELFDEFMKLLDEMDEDEDDRE